MGDGPVTRGLNLGEVPWVLPVGHGAISRIIHTSCRVSCLSVWGPLGRLVCLLCAEWSGLCRLVQAGWSEGCADPVQGRSAGHCRLNTVQPCCAVGGSWCRAG